MSISIWGLSAGIVVFGSTLVLIVAVMIKGGKEDLGAEFYKDFFVAYVRRRKTYTANVHSLKRGKQLVVKMTCNNYVQLQKDVLEWVKKREG